MTILSFKVGEVRKSVFMTTCAISFVLMSVEGPSLVHLLLARTWSRLEPE